MLGGRVGDVGDALALGFDACAWFVRADRRRGRENGRRPQRSGSGAGGALRPAKPGRLDPREPDSAAD